MQDSRAATPATSVTQHEQHPSIKFPSESVLIFAFPSCLHLVPYLSLMHPPSSSTRDPRIPLFHRHIHKHPRLVRRGPSASVWGILEAAYLTAIKISGQEFLLIVDTGSPDLWIASSECASSECRGIPRYNASISTTLRMHDPPVTWEMRYVSGKAQGMVAYDTIHLGDFQMENQAFALASNVSGLSLSGSGFSGILGLSFASPSAISPSVGQTLLNSLLVSLPSDDQRFIAFRFGHTGEPSSFTIGDHDPTIDRSTLRFSPVYPLSQGRDGDEYSYDYYKLELQSVLVNGVPLSLSKSKVKGSRTPIAVLDTGTTLILGPRKDVDTFYETIHRHSVPLPSSPKDSPSPSPSNPSHDGVLINPTRQTNEGIWQILCNRAIEVQFSLGVVGSFALDPQDVAWDFGTRLASASSSNQTSSSPHVDGDGGSSSRESRPDGSVWGSKSWGRGEMGSEDPNFKWCLGGIQANDDVISGDWLLGDAFLRNVYTSYHVPSSRTGNRALVGLSNLTDFPTALDQFTAERGVDRFGWSNDPAIDSSHRELSTRMQIVSLGLGSIGGFILGACLFLIFRIGAEAQTGWANFYERRGGGRVVGRRIVSTSGERGLEIGSIGRTGWKRRASRTVSKTKEG